MNETSLRVCSYESRRREEMSRLIERMQGIPLNAPSMREIPLSENPEAFTFAEKVLSGCVDLAVFMTGVGTEALFAALQTRNQDTPVLEALKTKLIVARGPKPAAALSRLGIKANLKAPEPNTWEEVVAELDRNQIELSAKVVAVQEYGQPSVEFYRWLESRGARVLPVPVYQWALPEDLEPLRESIRETIAGGHDVLLWTSAQQVNHVLEVAEAMGLKEEWMKAANRCVIGSIGPTASGRLVSLGLPPDLEPSHPKMAHLVRETLESGREILSRKSSVSPVPGSVAPEEC